MMTLLGTYLFILALILVGLMLRDHLRGECDLMSIRNVALLGFIIFQVTSGATALILDDYGRKAPINPVRTAIEFTAMTTVYIIIALWAYRRGWLVTRMASKVPKIKASPNNSGMLMLAAMVTLAAIFMRYGVRVQLIYKVTEMVGTGFAAIASGLVGWVWARRLFNPAIAIYSLAIVMANIMVVISSEFGRRGLVAVVAGLIWGMYFSAYRGLPLRKMLKKLALITIGPVIIVALFTSVRSGKIRDRTAIEYIQLMASGAPLSEGILDLVRGQDTAAKSMWFIDAYPEEFEYRHLFTIRWFLIFPYPREWWEGKPQPLAKLWVELANVRDVSPTLNIGPGIIGNAGAEGGWYALVIYALISGLFLKFFDELVLQNLNSPMMILIVGAALGEILALARGETGSFAAKSVIIMSGCYVIILILNRFLLPMGLATPVEEWDEYDEDDLSLEDVEDDSGDHPNL